MSVVVESADVERLRHFIAREFGLQFDDSRMGLLADVLYHRARVAPHGGESYLDHLESQRPPSELAALAADLTVAETYFFRNIDQFRAFSEVVLPDRLRARGVTSRLRILSAGCASGEEAYSLAIRAREHPSRPSCDVSIHAVDLNPAVLARAARAYYTEWAMRETPESTRRRWFHARGSEWALDEAIRDAVTFEECNLAADDTTLWRRGSYDVIFCRNVLMYFTAAASRRVVDRMAEALAPGGYLFLGHAETLRGVTSDFHLRHTHDTFYYQRKSGDAIEDPPRAAPPRPRGVEHDATTWTEAIRKSTQRIDALNHTATSKAQAPPVAPPRWDLGTTLALIRDERYREALEAVGALPPESANDPDVLLLRATLLTHDGQLHQAEEISRRLLQLDELNPGAHYLLALCREGAGDRRGAVEQDQLAIYLDPEFAMAQLHLGLMARRIGDRESARRDFERALALLQREEPARLLLFGGGFGRAALISMCRSEWIACGGRP